MCMPLIEADVTTDLMHEDGLESRWATRQGLDWLALPWWDDIVRSMEWDMQCWRTGGMAS